MAGEWTESGVRTFEADGAVAQHLRVKVESNGRVSVAGDEADIGTAHRAAAAAAENIGVRLRSAQGTALMVAVKAIAAGDVVNSVAGGKVTDAAGNAQIGVALEAAAADGDLIEVLRD